MKTNRIDIASLNPEAYKPLIDLNNFLKQSNLVAHEMDLIYLRASQINGCAFCVQTHTQEALDNGEKQYRIHALPYWEESPFFSDVEQIIIQVTEEVTAISSKGLSDNVYKKAVQILGKEKLADVIMAVATINAWNRIGRSTLLIPTPSEA